MRCDSFKSSDSDFATDESAVTCFLLMLLNFGSLRESLLVFTDIPLAMVGGVAALLFPVVIGGLVSSTALTLLVLPVLYGLFTERTKSNPPSGNKMRRREYDVGR